MKRTAIYVIVLCVITLFSCNQSGQQKVESNTEPVIEGLGLTEKDVVDSWIYTLARYLVIRQEHIDISEEGVDYNVIKFNELGKAEFVNPNLDVAYLEAWFAVDENTPVILEIPKIEGRYYTAQIMDEWAEILYNINERNFPNHPYGQYALCLEGSNPDIPEGAMRIDLPSKKAKMLARVERQGDDEGAVALQKAFKIIKVGDPEIEPAIEIPMFNNKELLTDGVFNKPMVKKVLASAPDAVSNAADYQKQVISIAEFIEENDENRSLIKEIIEQKAFKYLLAITMGEVRGDGRGGWISTRQWLEFGEDIEFRTSANYSGIWWNSSAEVVYYMGARDVENNPLNGDNVYIIHYKPEELPTKHVNAYWSLTMLSLPDYRVVPNELDRYNLNNISELVYEEDGSLKIYIGAVLPEGAPESNWLPAPAGKHFVMNHRLYVPKEEVLNGEYYVPAIQKAQ